MWGVILLLSFSLVFLGLSRIPTFSLHVYSMHKPKWRWFFNRKVAQVGLKLIM